MIPAPAPLLYLPQIPDQATIVSWLRELRLKAYVPGSSYKVASLIMMRVPGGFYFSGGVNVECYEHRLSNHGEESAIAALVAAFGKKAAIDAVWVMAAPGLLTGPTPDPMADIQGQTCGNCRQQISGLAASPDIPVQAISLNGNAVTDPISHLLPSSFSFADFDPEIHTQRQQDRQKTLDPAADILHKVLRKTPQTQGQIFDWLQSLESVDYASGIGQAVVLRLTSGAFVAGVRVENAAYTGLSAVQGAIGIAVTTFGSIEIAEIYQLSTVQKDEPPGRVHPLSGSSLQSLGEFVTDDDIPVTLFAQNGQSFTCPLSAMAQFLTRFAAPGYFIENGTIKTA